MKQVLHVGCGGKTIAHMPTPFQDGSWKEIRFDIDPGARPDLIGTMTDMNAVGSGSVDALFSSHNVEHLYPHEVPIAFAEFLRVLRPEGFAVITCPDLQSVAALVAEDKLLDPLYQSPIGPITPLDMIFGHRASVARGAVYMAHRGGFTIKTLTGAMAGAGFARAIGTRRMRAFELWALAVKQRVDDEVMKQLADSHFPS